MYYYINSFYIYGFIGFLFENIQSLITKGEFLKNILYEPVKPIYGLGVVIIIILERLIFNRFKFRKIWKIVCLFVLSTLVLTGLEELTGVLLEILFHKSYWNYSDLPFHFGKYISLEISLVWGAMSMLFLLFLQPFFDKIIKKIPIWFSNIMIIITIADICFVFINH